MFSLGASYSECWWREEFWNITHTWVRMCVCVCVCVCVQSSFGGSPYLQDVRQTEGWYPGARDRCFRPGGSCLSQGQLTTSPPRPPRFGWFGPDRVYKVPAFGTVLLKEWLKNETTVLTHLLSPSLHLQICLSALWHVSIQQTNSGKRCGCFSEATRGVTGVWSGTQTGTIL